MMLPPVVGTWLATMGPIVLAIGLFGCLVGIIWMRQILEIEPDSDPFRLRASGRRGWPAAAVAAGVLLLIASVYLGLTN